MYFLVDDVRKVIFGWSAKCGCSHIKSIFYFLQNGRTDNEIHNFPRDFNGLPENLQQYVVIMIIRNPYKRIVSGFLDKYAENGEYRHMWKHEKITFRMFVNEVVNKNWDVIEDHHFFPQTSEKYDIAAVTDSKSFTMYDIENINYKHIEKLYNTKIPMNLLLFRGSNARPIYKSTFDSSAIDLDMNVYHNRNVDIRNFYDESTKNIVREFYENDFRFFEQYGGFQYDIRSIQCEGGV
jgi:hypothetical protein